VRSIDQAMQTAIDNSDIPGIVAMAADRGGVIHAGAYGQMGLDNPAPMAVDTLFCIYSMTKAIGTTCAVMLIERGQLELDQPVGDILPAFDELPVLVGFDGDDPVLRPAKKRATIRHLATHTSGCGYQWASRRLARYFEVTGKPIAQSGKKAGLLAPLLFDPGTDWAYGISIDWLGQVVEAVTGQRIDRFCRDELFDPLGMADTVFEVDDDRAPRLASAHQRGRDGTLAVADRSPPSQPEFYGMGHALYSTAPDYLQFLRMLLGGGTLDGTRVLAPETVALMTQNHIGDLAVRKLISQRPGLSKDAELFPGVEKKHGLGFTFVTEDIPAMRRAGSQSWAGILNTHMWFDPKAGIAGVFLTQMLPFFDPPVIDAYGAFERAVYSGR